MSRGHHVLFVFNERDRRQQRSAFPFQDLEEAYYQLNAFPGQWNLGDRTYGNDDELYFNTVSLSYNGLPESRVTYKPLAGDITSQVTFASGGQAAGESMVNFCSNRSTRNGDRSFYRLPSV